jgi:hypothetical protein
MGFEPCDRAGEVDLFGRGSAVRSHEIDLGIVPPVPPAADRFGIRPALVRQQPEQGFADDRLDGASAPTGPGAFDALEQDVSSAAFDERDTALEEGEPEAQVRVGDAVAIVVKVRSPLPMASRTAREREASGNSPSRESSPAINSGESGSASSRRR